MSREVFMKALSVFFEPSEGNKCSIWQKNKFDKQKYCQASTSQNRWCWIRSLWKWMGIKGSEKQNKGTFGQAKLQTSWGNTACAVYSVSTVAVHIRGCLHSTGLLQITYWRKNKLSSLSPEPRKSNFCLLIAARDHQTISLPQPQQVG